jgi:hypothetical protein
MLGREVSYALYGTWRLVRLDPTGLAFFDRSLDGFWRSWWSLAFAYPAGLVITGIYAETLVETAFLRVAIVQAIGSLAGYAAYALLVLALVRFIDRSAQFFDYIVAYNWSQVPVGALFLFVAALDGSGVFGEAGILAYEAALAAWCVYHAYLALVSLRAGVPPAIAVVALDLLLGVLVAFIGNRLY